MAKQHVVCVIMLACCCSWSAGCGDPVRTTLQPVFLRVTNTISGEPVADVQVSLRWDYEHNVPIERQRPEDQRPTYDWFSGKTDPRGQAEVDVKSTMLDRTWGPTPPSWRDEVTGAAHLVSVKKDLIHEEHSLVMRPGASVKGEAFTVHVLQIQQPHYVKTDE